MTRKICYITGTRADFGLMARTLCLAQESGRLEVSVCVTGAHLRSEFGETVREIEESGLRIIARIPADVDGTTGAVMAKAIGKELIGITEALDRERPDLVLVLGDRGEMLAGALAAIHLNIPVVHLHGGERSGTVDEPVRHAISKLSHFHFVATKNARERLVRMGERPEHVIVTGAPGLDGLTTVKRVGRAEQCAAYGFDPGRPVALVVYHPVLQEIELAGRQAEQLMNAVVECNVQALIFMPNSDAGGREIGRVLQRYADWPDIRLLTHLGRAEYISWMAVADVMVGNSSSGIIEAASMGLRVVNVGARQRYRERNANTVDVTLESTSVVEAIRAALTAGRGYWQNIYGDEGAAERIIENLIRLPITSELLNKANAY